MKVGLVVGGTDRFLRPVEAELRRRHDCTRFEPYFVRLPLLGQRVNAWLLRRQLQRFIARHDVTFFEWASNLLIEASKLPNQGRIVTRLHAGEITWVDQINWSVVDAVIVLNAFYREQLLLNQVIEPARVTIVANGVNLQQFSPKVRCFQYHVGMVCSVVPIKRVYESVLALYEVRKIGLPYTLHVAGDYADSRSMNEGALYWPALKQLIARLELTESVVFYGPVDNIDKWLESIDVFISNSYWEGQQVALLEAMATGCYCLGHCWRGIEGILPEEHTFVTESELIGKLVAYANYTEAKRIQACEQMRGLAEQHFDERRMVTQVIEVLETAASRS